MMDATTGIPPAVTEETEMFWAAAKEGRLVVEGCSSCGAESFPPRGMCRSCRGRTMVPVEITSHGHVYSLTVNYQRWLPDLEVPYAIVLVEFRDHPGVRVVGRLRGCPPEEAAIGMTVDIGFEPGPGGYAIPSFVALLARGDDPPRPPREGIARGDDPPRPPREGMAGGPDGI